MPNRRTGFDNHAWSELYIHADPGVVRDDCRRMDHLIDALHRQQNVRGAGKTQLRIANHDDCLSRKLARSHNHTSGAALLHISVKLLLGVA